ncbi:hypothetical protein Emed_005843 [Eimeria media]
MSHWRASCFPPRETALPKGTLSRLSSAENADAVAAAAAPAAAVAAATAAAAAAASAADELHAGHELKRESSRQASLSEAPQDIEGPFGAPSPPRFVAARVAASAPNRHSDEERGAPEGAPPAAGDFELPLLLLQPSSQVASAGGPPGGAPTGDEWRQEVSASVAAAFRDLQSNMHLRSSNSRAMRIGLGEALLQGSSGEFQDAISPQPVTEGAPPSFSNAEASLQRLSSDAERAAGSLQSEGPPREAGAPRELPKKGPPSESQSAHSHQTRHDGGPGGGPLLPSSSTHEGPPPQRQGSAGAPASQTQAGSATCAEGSPPSAAELQHEFLSAYNIAPQQAAAIAEAAEAAEAGEGADARNKAAAFSRVGTSSSSSTASLGRLLSDNRGPPPQTAAQGPPPTEGRPGPPETAGSFSASASGWSKNRSNEFKGSPKKQWARGLFRRQGTSTVGGPATTRDFPERSSTSLSGKMTGRSAIDSDRANVGLGSSLQRLKGDRAALWSATISPKGEWLAAAGQTGVVFLWSIPGPRGSRSSQGAPASQGPRADAGGPFKERPTMNAEAAPKGAPPSCTYLQGGPPLGRPLSIGSASLEGLAEGGGVGGPSSPRRASGAPSASVWGPSGVGPPLRSEWFLRDRPDLCLTGHGASVIFLAWAPTTKMSLLLSASLDKSVRLWRPSKGVAAIAVLRCTDWPTCASFHPIFKDVIFTGCLDATIQVWRLLSSRAPGTPGAPRGAPEQFESRIVEYLKVPELVTALSISPNGGILAVGFRNGSISFYDARTLKFRSEVDCKNRKGKFAKGRKVTSLEWLPDGSCLCVATNDSRIRIFDVMSLTCIYKFKGHVNSQIMLRASYTKPLVPQQDNAAIFAPALAATAAFVVAAAAALAATVVTVALAATVVAVTAPLASVAVAAAAYIAAAAAACVFGGLGVVCGSEFGRVCYWKAAGPGGDSFYDKARLAHWKRVTNTSFEDFKVHPLPARAPLSSRGPPLPSRGPSQLPPLQQQQLQQMQLQQQQGDHSPVGTVKVYGDSSGQVITSISGGPSLGGPAAGGPPPAGATRRSRIRSMLSLKKSSPSLNPQAGPQGGPSGAPQSSPPGGPVHSPQQGPQLPPPADGGPPKDVGAPEGPSSGAPAAAHAPPATSAPSSPTAGAVAAVAAAATAAAAAEGATAADGGGLCDSDDSDWCAASLAALSVMETAGGGPPRGTRGPRGPLEGRPLCWRAGKRLHLGLPPESYALCKQQSEAANLVVVAGSYNGKIRIFANLAGALNPQP